MKHLGILFISILLISCSDKSLSEKEINNYTAKGKEIGKATLKKLGGDLMQQMKNGGVVQALPFCNAAAIPLTHELSNNYKVTIKRTSDKLRNMANKPSKEEEVIINQYLNALYNGEEIKPIVSKDNNGKVHFYAPIKIEKKCLSCHGDVSKSTASIIKLYYPNDKAIGYKEGDLRGVMSIGFN